MRILTCISLLSVLLGCDRPNTSLAPPPDPSDRTYQDAAMPRSSSLVLEMGEPIFSDGPTGPYRLSIREIDTDVVTDLEAALFVDSWPHRVELPKELSGRYKVIAYLDSNNDQSLNNCPFPPSTIDTESSESIDNIQASTIVTIPSATDQTLTLQRRICGPGDINTGLEGTILGLSEIENVPLKMLIQREADDQAPETSPLRVSLMAFPTENMNTFGFSVGELLPGNYTITLFIDNDGDNSPTPCSSRGGGADRGVVVAENIAIQDGQRISIEAPFVFEESVCPDNLTGFTGEIKLGPTLDPSLAELGTITAEIDGEFWIQLVRSDGSETPTSLKILNTIKGRPNPLKYTVTGIEPGLWNVTAFLDRDDSNDFSPCNVVSGGLDVVTGRLESIRIREDEVDEVDAIDLNALECGGESLSGIRGELTIDRESGAIGSGRTVLMRVEGVENGIQETLLLFDDHTRVTGNFDRFVQKLAPGNYVAEVFVDINGNGTYEPCSPDSYGDRYHSEVIDIELDPGVLLDIGRIELRPRECSMAEQDIQVNLDIDPNIVAERPNELNIWVREAGGWGLTSSFDAWEEFEDTWTIDYGRLPPGNYTFSLYSDDDGNGSLSTCDSETPDRYFAQFEISLREDIPYSPISVPLGYQCN